MDVVTYVNRRLKVDFYHWALFVEESSDGFLDLASCELGANDNQAVSFLSIVIYSFAAIVMLRVDLVKEHDVGLHRCATFSALGNDAKVLSSEFLSRDGLFRSCSKCRIEPLYRG